MARARRFIETHWLFFAFQGIISVLFGAFILFTNITVISSLIAVIGVSLLCLGVIEIFSMLYRKHYGNSLALSLILAASEVIIAMMLLFTQDYNMVWALTLLAIYTIGRGILELILAFTAVTDKTDRFMWVTCGICGVIIGIVILNSGGFLDQTAFTKFFSAYMMIFFRFIFGFVFLFTIKCNLSKNTDNRRIFSSVYNFICRSSKSLFQRYFN